MFVNRSPEFGTGKILKKEMLENLRDFPRTFVELYFKDFSNGILCGAECIVGEGNITISKGIVKHENRIYILEEDFVMPCFTTNKEVVIKIKFFEELMEGDFISNTTKIWIDENTSIEKDELELGRFKLRESAQLRSEYKDFYDFATEYNTLNVINTEYAGFEKSTMNPAVLRYFSKILLTHKVDNPYDIAFSMQCMNNRTISREVLLFYIANRLGMEFKEYSNMQIYKQLCHIVREVESGVKRKVETRTNKAPRIIVD